MKFGPIEGQRLYLAIGSIAIAVLGYLAFSLWGGWRDVLAAFSAVGVGGVLIALLLSAANYGLRFARWQLFLGALGHPTPAGSSALIYISGFALTTTPGKAGEMLRGVFLKLRGVPYTQSMAAFLSERLSDLVAVVVLSLFGISLYPQGVVTIAIGLVAVALGLLLLSQRSWLDLLLARLQHGHGRINRVLRHSLALMIEACCCHTPKMLAISCTLSLLAWSAEAYAFYLILHWIGSEVGLNFAFSVYGLATLAGAISFLPGGLGGAEAVMVSLLILSGMHEAEAVAATIVIRLTTLWFAVALGGLTLVFARRSLNGEVRSSAVL
jgi:uncharacterized protein (TIRG00374 family)